MTNAETTAAEARNYLVTFNHNLGGGSWSRGPDLERAVEDCRRIAHSDWGHLFKIDGVEVTLNLYDVTGQDSVEIGPGYVSGDNPATAIQSLGRRVVRLPAKRKGRR